MKQIKIKDKDYNVKYSLRALFIFESITKKAFRIETMLDNYIFFYSMILAANPDNPLDWDDFIDAMDEDPTLLQRMNDIINEQTKQNALFEEEDKGGTDKKKVKRK